MSSLFVYIPSCQEVLKQIPQELQRDILERERSTVKEFKQEQALTLIKRNHGSHLFIPKRRIALLYQLLYICTRNFFLINVELEYFHRELLEGQIGPFLFPIRRQLRYTLRNEKTAVFSKAFNYSFLKGNVASTTSS